MFFFLLVKGLTRLKGEKTVSNCWCRFNEMFEDVLRDLTEIYFSFSVVFFFEFFLRKRKSGFWFGVRDLLTVPSFVGFLDLKINHVFEDTFTKEVFNEISAHRLVRRVHIWA